MWTLSPHGDKNMKKPSKTAAELEAWAVRVVQEGAAEDAERRAMVEQTAARLKAEYDLGNEALFANGDLP